MRRPRPCSRAHEDGFRQPPGRPWLSVSPCPKAGAHTFQWDDTGNASGMYIVRISGSGRVRSWRVTLLK